MDPISLTVLGLITWIKAHAVLVGAGVLAAGLTLASWAFIVHLFQTFLIPFIRRSLGDWVADGLAMFLSRMDDVATLSQRAFKQAWQAFKTKVLRWNTTFEKVSSSHVKVKSEAYVHSDDGKVKRSIVEEEVAWEDVPDDIRRTMMTNNQRQVGADSKQATCKVVDEVARENNISLDS